MPAIDERPRQIIHNRFGGLTRIKVGPLFQLADIIIIVEYCANITKY